MPRVQGPADMSRKANPVPSYAESRTLDFIRAYWIEHGYSPNLREISNHLNCDSTSLAQYYVRRLARMGKVRFTPRVARSIVVL
jgi:SOS-response transcriptional repressor LexA